MSRVAVNMSRVAAAVLFALLAPEAHAAGAVGAPALRASALAAREVDPAAADDKIVLSAPVKTEEQPEEEPEAMSAAEEEPAEEPTVEAAVDDSVNMVADDDNEGERDAVDDDEEGEAENNGDKAATGSDIDLVLAQETREATEVADEETQKEAAEIEVSDEDEAEDEDEDGDVDEDEGEDESEDTEDTSAEDPMEE
mmetsp:Transcript_63365/g.185900  ORF Transcript_63365/g.185900 Transcript_63365/m.185900 type:complete len:197 (+) Transcript_63365:95-685(+)